MKIEIISARSSEEHAVNIRRLTEAGQRSAAKVVQESAGFLATKNAMHERIRAEDERRSLTTRQQALVLRETGVMPPDAFDEPTDAPPDAA